MIKKLIFVIFACFPTAIQTKNMLLIIDYQYDFLPGGALGPPATEPAYTFEEDAEGQNIMSLIDDIKDDEYIMYSQDFHPIDHISFKSYHIGRINNMDESEMDNDTKEKLVDYITKMSHLDTIQIIYNEDNQVARINYLTEEKEPVMEQTNEFYLEQELWPNHCVNNEADQSGGINMPPALLEKIKTRTNNEQVKKGFLQEVDSYSMVKNQLKILFSTVMDRINETQATNIFLVGIAINFCVMNSANDILNLDDSLNVYIVTDASKSIGEFEAAIEVAKQKNSKIEFITTEKAKEIMNGRRILI